MWNKIDVGGRMVICRNKNDGNLLVHSPVERTPELAGKYRTNHSMFE